MGKALASLERSVGAQLNQHPPAGAEGLLVPDAPPPPHFADMLAAADVEVLVAEPPSAGTDSLAD